MKRFYRNILFILLIFLVFSTASFPYENQKIWASAEYLYWWPQNSSIGVPLITENNNPSSLAMINEPGTHIIFGKGSNKNDFNFGGMSGARMTLGCWLDKRNQYGFESSIYGFSDASNSYQASSLNKSNVINIPFITTQAVDNPLITLPTGSEDVLVFKKPNTATVNSTFNTWGLELNSLYNLENRKTFPFIFLLGARYINLTEQLLLNDAIYGISPNSIVNVRDKFSTRNNFYGLQIGARKRYHSQQINFELTTLLAFGNTHQILQINGQTNLNNQSILQHIGLFAEPSNIGQTSNNQFTFIPELRAKLEYNLTRYCHPFVAYDVFYINNIIRPAQQIDRRINLSQNPLLGGTGILTGAPSPIAKLNNNSFWMQGGSIGLELLLE